MDDSDKWETASVSVQVTSQTSDLPFFHGIIVIPSGRLPSSLRTPVGSRMQGILAEEKARFKMSLRQLCLEILPALFMQDNP
jgi:hypothetical protein